MVDEINFPDASKWYVKALRFTNMLDDGHNMLSPVKLNVWAANIGMVSTILGSALAWLSGHAGLIGEVGTLSMTWLTHAHTVHHFDKKERNKTAIETMKVNQSK